jgi:hypothetical protein
LLFQNLRVAYTYTYGGGIYSYFSLLMTDVTKDQIKTDQNANKAVNNFDPSKNKQWWNTEPTTPKKDQETPTTPATK